MTHPNLLATNIGRIPSFNDFSPGILKGDLRPILNAIAANSGNDEAIFIEWVAIFGSGFKSTRLRNILITLEFIGLTTGNPLKLSDLGERVRSASSARQAAAVFCGEIIQKQNGLKVIEAISILKKKGERATKKSLQTELERLGVSELANDTTDHTTLKNWMIEAGLVIEIRKGFPDVNDSVLKALTGISSSEYDELGTLPLGQRVFLQLLRKRSVAEMGPFGVSDLYTECRATHPHAFRSGSLAATITGPLSAAGWIQLRKLVGGGRGGKSGSVVGTTKLLDIPVDRVIPEFSSTVPADLRSKVQTALPQIRTWLDGSDTHLGGLALELLALRIILDLRLTPREFRLRSKDSAFAEVDVTAEGSHLLFSRWTFQCKRLQKATNVGLGDVAKEVGIAIYMKAHVIVMVSTGGFTGEALNYAREISRATHLQFLFLDKRVIKAYLTDGAESLHAFVMANAAHVLVDKKSQKISPTMAT